MRCCLFVLLLFACEPLAAHPPLCSEDSHCAVNFFCGSPYCIECLDCSKLNRSPPLQQRTCLKSGAECGPCYEGWILHESYSGSAKCVVAATNTVGLTRGFYVWITGAGFAIGILITVVYLHLFQNTTIFEIVQYYVPANAAAKGPTIPVTTITSLLSKQKPEKQDNFFA